MHLPPDFSLVSSSQVCLIKLQQPQSKHETVNLIQHSVKMNPEAERSFADFYLTEEPSFSEEDSDETIVQMKITFKRTLSIEAINTFLPSLLLILLSYITAFFKLPKFFNTAITVNLSVMLTITTLLISVLNKLPTTSYIKWIEYWLIFALMAPFTQVILITAIQWLMEEAESTQNTISPQGEQCWMEDKREV